MAWPIPTSGEAMVQLKGRVGSSRGYRRFRRKSASKRYTKAQKIWMPYTCLLSTSTQYNAPYVLNGGHPVFNPSSTDATHPWLGDPDPFMPVNFWPQWAGAEEAKSGLFENGCQLLRVQGSIYVTLHAPTYQFLSVNDAAARYQLHSARCPIDSLLMWHWRLIRSDSGIADDPSQFSELSPSFQVIDDGTGAPATDMLRDNIALASSKHLLSHGVIPISLTRWALDPLLLAGDSVNIMDALSQRPGWYMRPFRLPLPRIPKSTGLKMDKQTRLQLVCQLRRADGLDWQNVSIAIESEAAFLESEGSPNTYPFGSAEDPSSYSDLQVPRIMAWPHLRFLLAR